VVRIERRILSPTAINTYLFCPRKFYLRYIKRLRTKPSIHLIRGHIVHRTIHDFHKNHPRVVPGMSLRTLRQELLDIFERHWEEARESLKSLGLTKEEIESYHDDSQLMLLNFSHWFYKNNIPIPDLSETKIVSKNLRLMGIIDAVHQWPDRVILVDYKTSKYPAITNDIQRQAALYALLYRDKYKKVPEAVWIHFLKMPDDPQPIYIDEEFLNYGKILIESVAEKTTSFDEHSYPCTCGGYCEGDFIRD
jgi:CRISPR/Cas system-associated exonuclease Cas4 (RecB family)